MIRGGRSYVSSPPAFSNDATRLLLCTGDSVSVFSTATALQVSSLEGHTAQVTSVVVVPETSLAVKSCCFCWTASLDGTIRYWDFSVPELRKTVEVHMPIHSMVIPYPLEQTSESWERRRNVCAYISVENKKTESPKVKGEKVKILRGQIMKCNLSESRFNTGLILIQSEQPECLTISPSHKFFGIGTKRKLCIWNVPEKDLANLAPKKILLHHTKNLTALAFHPNERIVAAGDSSGRILVWRNFGCQTFLKAKNGINEEVRPGVRGDDEADSCSTWHWHSDEVSVLSFSSDGTYLYSGGREGVLVVWQIDTGKKKFLPRIGSPLRYFIYSSDPSLASMSCADNRIHFLKMPAMHVLKSISGIKLPLLIPKKKEGLCSKFAFDYSSGLIALRTENYCVQLYSLFDDREVSEVQVTERNHQPGDEVTVVVTAVELSLDGATMCTTEVRLPEEGIGALVCLKFWTSEPLNKNFTLSTIIYEPHSDALVSAVAFHPNSRMAVSTSYGGDFKLWVSRHDIPKDGDAVRNSGWMCLSVGSYKKKPMTSAAFSADGSILAVAAETVITLWDPENNYLVAVLGETQSPITSMTFAGKSDCLVSVSRGARSQLSAWSMSELNVSWSYKLQVEDVACAVDLATFAVLALLPKSYTGVGSEARTCEERDGIILMFGPTDPVPVATWSVKKANGGGIAYIQENQQSGIAGEQSEPLLVYINGDHEYVVFDPRETKACEVSLTKRHANALEEQPGKFGYSSIYGELPEFELKNKQASSYPSSLPEQPWERRIGSTISLPPSSKLCSCFFASIQEKRSSDPE